MKNYRKITKKKFTLPRMMWHRNPVTKIKESAKIYNRKKIREER